MLPTQQGHLLKQRTTLLSKSPLKLEKHLTGMGTLKKSQKISEHVREQQTLKQAIQSLLAGGSRYMPKTLETAGMQGAYQAFGCRRGEFGN